MTSRRKFLLTGAMGFLGTPMGMASLKEESTLEDLAMPTPTSWNDVSGTREGSVMGIIVDKKYKPASSERFVEDVVGATYDVLETMYKGKNVPIWHRSFGRVPRLKKRIDYATGLIADAVAKEKSVWPVDPAWIAAMIMQESCFRETAVSGVGALGMCQFMEPTGIQYGMDVARSSNAKGMIRPEHKRRFVSYSAAADGSSLKETYRKQYVKFLKDNLKGKDIFNSVPDGKWVQTFDQRASPKIAIPAMVKYMASALRKTHGNLMAATASYNAGLGNVQKDSMGAYEYYGQVPNFRETVKYVNHVTANYGFIRGRM